MSKKLKKKKKNVLELLSYIITVRPFLLLVAVGTLIVVVAAELNHCPCSPLCVQCKGTPLVLNIMLFD